MISRSFKSVMRNKQAVRALQNQSTPMLGSVQHRSAGGGEKKPAMSADKTDFDVLLVGKYSLKQKALPLTLILFFHLIGGLNATALTKFLQAEDNGWDMALVTDAKGKFIMPQNYFGALHHHIKPLDMESSTISSQVSNWSRVDSGKRVVKYMPE